MRPQSWYRVVFPLLGALTIACLGITASGIFESVRNANGGITNTDARPVDAFRPALRPMPVPPHPVSGVIEDDELHSVLTSVEPFFDRRLTLDAFPVHLVVHALRLWGTGVIPGRGRAVGGQEIVDGLTGKEMVETLLSHEAFTKYSKVRAPGLLRRSTAGVEAIVGGDYSFSASQVVPHLGKLTHVAAEVGLASDQPITTLEGYRGTLSELIADDAIRCVAGVELEWLVSGISRYATSDRPWTNRFGLRCTFDDLANLVLDTRPGTGACDGIHVPYAVAILLRVHERLPILKGETRDRARRFLTRLSAHLTEHQRVDGDWGWDWADGLPRGVVTPKLLGVLGEPLPTTVLVTGHHLEWMAIAPIDCRPGDEVIRRAARALIRIWPEFDGQLRNNWHLYDLGTHAARGLWLLSGAADLNHPNIKRPL